MTTNASWGETLVLDRLDARRDKINSPRCSVWVIIKEFNLTRFAPSVTADIVAIVCRALKLQLTRKINVWQYVCCTFRDMMRGLCVSANVVPPAYI